MLATLGKATAGNPAAQKLVQRTFAAFAEAIFSKKGAAEAFRLAGKNCIEGKSVAISQGKELAIVLRDAIATVVWDEDPERNEQMKLAMTTTIEILATVANVANTK